MLKKIKHLHIMTHPSVYFNGNIIKMINENNEDFISDDHLFITSNLEVFKENSNFINVKYVPKIMSTNIMTFFKYANKAENIFLHQNWFYDFVRLVFTPISIRKKYIWCVWGHDLYTDHGEAFGIKEKIKSILRKVGDIIIAFEIRWYRAIGIGFKYDALEIKKRFKDKVEIIFCPYPTGTELNKIKEIEKTNRNVLNKKTKIMIGHSAFPYLHHIEMLDKLSFYKNEHIIISIPLVYGNATYGNEVEKYAKEKFGEENVEIIKDRLNIYEYIKYIQTIDILIADQKHQTGLGNLYYAMFFRKKIFLNPSGKFKQFFILEGIEYDSTDKLGIINFEELTSTFSSLEKGYEYSKFILNEKTWIDMWKDTFNYLNKS